MLPEKGKVYDAITGRSSNKGNQGCEGQLGSTKSASIGIEQYFARTFGIRDTGGNIKAYVN
jgi:hypothetical protein